jgi:hypothetical protein
MHEVKMEKTKEQIMDEIEDLYVQRRVVNEAIQSLEDQYAQMISPFKQGDVIQWKRSSKKPKLLVESIHYRNKTSVFAWGRLFKLDGKVGFKRMKAASDLGWEKVE